MRLGGLLTVRLGTGRLSRAFNKCRLAAGRRPKRELLSPRPRTRTLRFFFTRYVARAVESERTTSLLPFLFLPGIVPTGFSASAWSRPNA